MESVVNESGSENDSEPPAPRKGKFSRIFGTVTLPQLQQPCLNQKESREKSTFTCSTRPFTLTSVH